MSPKITPKAAEKLRKNTRLYMWHIFIMDILYYSTQCKHCPAVLNFLKTNNLWDKLHCISIDRRAVDPRTGQIFITLENGTQKPMPPTIQDIPALLQVSNKYEVVLGSAIIAHLQAKYNVQSSSTDPRQMSEPVGHSLLDSAQIFSATSEPYSNYVTNNHPIVTPSTDLYRSDKIRADEINMGALQQARAEDVNKYMPAPPFEYSNF